MSLAANQNPIAIWIPVFTAVLTFVLTSIFTLYRERKTANVSKRIFFDYSEYSLPYPFDDETVKLHGEGIILFGDNGSFLKTEPGPYSFMVIRNVTENNAINVRIKTKYSANGKTVVEDFYMPIWKNDMTVYLPQTVYDSGSLYSTNESLVITYTTTNFEKFKYSYALLKPRRKWMFWRKKNVKYRELLKKKWFGLFWVRKIKYNQSGFYSHRLVRISDSDK